MKYYLILATSITGLTGKQLREGEPHPETEFIAGHCEKLAANQCIQEISEAEYQAKVAEAAQRHNQKKKPAAVPAIVNAGGAETPQMVDFKITKEYLKAHPELAEAGKKAGDVIQVPATEAPTE
jgi:hypothetical protein